MGYIRKWFLNQDMSWFKVVIMAVITAIITAVLNLIPSLRDTSFQDIAINLDCWILFAVFIIVNCEKWWEASLKTFVFFLVSQPLIYLIEVPFVALGFGLFQYYKYWFMITLLTLPGAAIAFLLKRRDWISVFVLSVATCFLSYMAADYFWSVKAHFPHHLFSLIFCITISVFFIFIFLGKRIHRIVGMVIVTVVFVISVFLTKPIIVHEIYLPDGNWSYYVEDDSLIEIRDEDSNSYTVTAVKEGSTFITFEDELGNIEEYHVSVTGGGIFVNKLN